MALEQITEHVQEALNNLLAQFKGKPKIAGLITSYVNQIQDLEDVFFQLLIDRWLDNAEGVQLDGFGSIVGQAREGKNDDDYRLAIKAKIQLNLSEGTTEDIIDILRAALGLFTVEVVEYFPAAFTAELVEPLDPSTNPNVLAVILNSGRSAGVKSVLLFKVADPFQYDTGLGYDEGHYAGAL